LQVCKLLNYQILTQLDNSTGYWFGREALEAQAADAFCIYGLTIPNTAKKTSVLKAELLIQLILFDVKGPN